MSAGAPPATGPAGTRQGLRVLVIVVAALESGVLLMFVGVMVAMTLSSDPLGRAIGQGVATLAAIPLIAFALPALILAVVNRWLTIALLLAALAVPVAVVLFVYA